MNLSKLQSEAVKKISDVIICNYTHSEDCNHKTGDSDKCNCMTNAIYKDDIEEISKIISDQIQKAYEAGLKDAVDKYFLDAEKRLSIQSKGK
jgi:hypothetical protein